MNSRAYMETRILSADPLELINIFYEYAIVYVQEARDRLAMKDIAGRSRAISKAIRIVGELEASLNHSVGGEISINLAKLYGYMRARLMTANLKQQDAPLGEVESLLKTLAEAWSAISSAKQARSDSAEAMPGRQWSGSFSADTVSEYAAHSWSV